MSKPKRVSRPSVRAGYDLWAASYDHTANPLVALDRRHTVGHLQPRRGERILDAGCGTGGHLCGILGAGARPVGVDFSEGMLRVAQRALPGVSLVQADLNRDLPIQRASFDAVLCALVSEHLQNLRTVFAEAFAVLRTGGRLVFSAFHPRWPERAWKRTSNPAAPSTGSARYATLSTTISDISRARDFRTCDGRSTV